ncbi:DUF1223 domain-containing protein [Paracoccus salsus]|uniref:DUF1223 domain-containing protein n=1 Tax=Paracoccus salsus TaxID=2911061 RepID=UPI001F36C156|nr:DUF1223 domain-containing protein [Paracoccus salsus]MCF3973879.1 DUF1223 domain-containing protein [Paracoccus salsus]
MRKRPAGLGTGSAAWRCAAAALAVTASFPVGPVAAQQGASTTSGSAAPVIAAPATPGRAVPGAMGFNAGAERGLNSFSPFESVPPSLDSFTPPGLPVVVELFTSQGCSSCPPVDAMLAELAGEPGVLPLSYHVDYWDYLGWADEFARPEFTARQERYARASGERALYTPQLIVDGRDTAVSPGPAELMGLIDANRMSPAMISLRRESVADGEVIELMPLSDLGGQVEILLVRYAPERKSDMTAGENRGRTVTYTNVVLHMDRLAHWDGMATLKLTIKPDGQPDAHFPEDTRHALLIQKLVADEQYPGPIVAAIRLD